MTGFGAYTAAWATAVRLRGCPLPDRPQPWDVVLTSVATFRLSRLLSKASVTGPLRAPFTRYVGPQGPAELHEEADPEGGKGTPRTCTSECIESEMPPPERHWITFDTRNARICGTDGRRGRQYLRPEFDADSTRAVCSASKHAL
ncbi:DUF1360 domain-containing protein [Streptomyces tailanensis]|uniref:DUF1360 domain-containing protein n=1 Tax=Streptomyces tailanensis TaxID=2569858 RepID=UPI001FE7DFFB|nr:DUF1360 domain-containing protein [Streptomyces tailanensis]